MPERPGWDEWALGIAAAVATRADCTRRRVGAVLLDEHHRIIATGYNGAPGGMPGCLSDGACPRGRLSYEEVREFSDYDSGPGRCVATHGEVNALLNATRDTRGATCYVTDPPCPGCTRTLAAAGVVRAVWPGGEMVPTEQLARTLMVHDH